MARRIQGDILHFEIQPVPSLIVITDQMQGTMERRLVLYGLIIAGFAFSFFAAFTEIPAGGADNFAHFNISKWAFRYPHLFLDHWGKPVFTILTAPFAQAGMLGVRIFNIVCGLLTAWFTYELLRHFNLRFAWLSVFVVLFTPIYFVMMFSGMTETLFSLFVVVSIFLFFKEKYILSAILISFVFLVRTEGLPYIFLFLPGFLIKRQYKAIPFLFTGFILFSVAGWLFHYHDFFWLINERPYATAGTTIYGSGSWYYYLTEMPVYFGRIVQVAVFAGSLAMMIAWLTSRGKLNHNAFLQVLLILGSFWGYFFIHSYLWWVGETSAGLHRVMAGVSPLVAMMAVFALNTHLKPTHWNTFIAAFAWVLTGILAVSAIQYHDKAIGHNPSSEVLKRVSLWLKEPQQARHKLVIHDPYFAFSTGVDAWDTDVVQYGFLNNDFPGDGLPDSTLFVWDAHFSAYEGRLPLEKIMDSPDFELIRQFKPVVPFKVWGESEYQILVFRKLGGFGGDNRAILQSLVNDEIKNSIYHIERIDFDNSFQDEATELRRVLKDSVSRDFVYSMRGVEFSPVFEVPEEKIDRGHPGKIRLSSEMLLAEPVQEGRLLLVFSVEGHNQHYHYATADITKQNPGYGVWAKVAYIFDMPAEIRKGATLKAYIWNMDKNDVFLDNFTLELIRQPS